MKKLFLSIIALGSLQAYGLLGALKPAHSPAVTIASVREALYQQQKSLMKRAQYETYITPYLEEAARDLEFVRYCFSNEDNAFSHRCVESFTRYVVADFHRIALNSTSSYLLTTGTMLRDLIEEYQMNVNNSLNVQDEFDKFTALIRRANKNYYKKLALVNRLFCWSTRVSRILFPNPII